MSASSRPVLAQYTGPPLVPRGLAEFADRAAVQIDIVITLSDAAATALRGPWPGGPVRSHWGLADPARAEGTGAERRGVFEAAFEQIEGRIAKLAALPVGTLGRGAKFAWMRPFGVSACAPTSNAARAEATNPNLRTIAILPRWGRLSGERRDGGQECTEAALSTVDKASSILRVALS